MRNIDRVEEGESMDKVLEKMRQVQKVFNAFLNARPGIGGSDKIVISDSNVVFQLRAHA